MPTPRSQNPGSSPVVVVVSGPNGAGKSTSAERFLPGNLHVDDFVNADTIARGLSAFDPEGAAIAAGRIMLQRLEQLGKERRDFAFETTLSSRGFSRLLRRLQSDGYRFHLVYVWLQRPELAVERVRLRVSRGGHSIPPDTVHRRYWRGMQNFRELYQPIADWWVLCDNTSGQLVQIAEGSRDVTMGVFDHDLYDRFNRALDRAGSEAVEE